MRATSPPVWVQEAESNRQSNNLTCSFYDTIKAESKGGAKMNFAERLKKLRADKGISQAALAQAIHISRSAVAKWENGLGLPSQDSLRILSEYFGVSETQLLSDRDGEQTIVSKSCTIDTQSKIIIALACGCGLLLILMGYFFIEPLRGLMELIVLGVILIILGAFNIRGNIASIHWYNRRKVTKENQLAYCRLVGLGTVIVGAGMLGSAAAQALLFKIIGTDPAAIIGAGLTLAGVVVGLVLILIAQFKYNKGLF